MTRQIDPTTTCNGSEFVLSLPARKSVVVFDDAELERALDAVPFMIYSLSGERYTRMVKVPNRSCSFAMSVRGSVCFGS
jgi:acyl-CoA reductase-like NAD-dependent aldehyde dehydrogenase